tara:strand:- start:693 stop:1166 length:474 start_codon:yes stop_codon:yes gene_type:complete
MRRKGSRPSHADVLRQNDVSTKWYAAMAGKPVPESLLNNKAAPKARVSRMKTGESEADILKAVYAYLKHHPKMAVLGRYNSGTFRDGNRYIRSNTMRGQSDLQGTLKDGRTIAVEVKSAKGKLMPHQKEYLDAIIAAHGVAFCCHSLDQCIAEMGKI